MTDRFAPLCGPSAFRLAHLLSMPHRPLGPTVIPARAASPPVVPLFPSGQPSPRVHVVHSPGGTITIVGVTLAGEWVAEYRCLADDFDERCVKAMERRVKWKEAKLTAARALKALKAVTPRVIAFPAPSSAEPE